MQVQALTIDLAPGETAPASGSPVRGVLTLEGKNNAGGYAPIEYAVELGAGSAKPLPAATPAAVLVPSPVTDDAITLWRALLLAFVGGVILNLMPCVFPVLSIKALGLLKHSDLSAAEKRAQGLVYTLGVLASFSVLALALIVIKSLGAQVGWGFQFQSPYFVLGVAYLIFVVGLSLSGCLRWAARPTWAQGWQTSLATAAAFSPASLLPLSRRPAPHRSWARRSASR